MFQLKLRKRPISQIWVLGTGIHYISDPDRNEISVLLDVIFVLQSMFVFGVYCFLSALLRQEYCLLISGLYHHIVTW